MGHQSDKIGYLFVFMNFKSLGKDQVRFYQEKRKGFRYYGISLFRELVKGIKFRTIYKFRWYCEEMTKLRPNTKNSVVQFIVNLVKFFVVLSEKEIFFF